MFKEAMATRAGAVQCQGNTLRYEKVLDPHKNADGYQPIALQVVTPDLLFKCPFHGWQSSR